MKLTTTFVPTRRIDKLLDRLFVTYTLGEPTHETLVDLRSELGRKEFVHFEDDLVHLMRTHTAWRAVDRIHEAASMRRTQGQPTTRQIYQPAEA